MERWLKIAAVLAGLYAAPTGAKASESPFERAAWSDGAFSSPMIDWQRIVRAQEEESVYDEPLATDRPDFTEASSAVGRGVLQIETGYTYFYDSEGGTRVRSHTGPESLFRYGITDNVEVRFVWNYLWTDTSEAGVTERENGAEDLVAGFKFALTTQSEWIPESALILDMSSPTGGTGTSNEHTEFGSNYLFGWDLPNDKSIAGSFGYSTGTEVISVPTPVVSTNDRHSVFHASITHGIPLTESWNAYFEYFGLYFDGLAGGRPQNYFDTGVTHLFNNNLQFDMRLGVGLNPSADDFFAGTGLSMRF